MTWDLRRKMGKRRMRDLLTGRLCVGGYRMDLQAAIDSLAPLPAPQDHLRAQRMCMSCPSPGPVHRKV